MSSGLFKLLLSINSIIDFLLIIIIYSLRVFHISFSWWFSMESEWQEVSWTLLSIQTVVVWMVSTRPLTFNNPFVTVSKAPITMDAFGTIHSPYFFSIPSQDRGTYQSFNILSLLFCGQPGQQSQQFCKFCCCWLQGLVFWPRLCDPFVCQSSIGVCVSFSWTATWLCIYHLFVWSTLNFLHISKWITLPDQSCLVLYSSCANLLFSQIMWSIVSSLSLQNIFSILLLLIYSRLDMISS